MRVRARVEGRVQGVGFRPAVYRHAVACGLTGFVRNDPQGVTLDVEGDEERLTTFFEGLKGHAPQRAEIIRVTTRKLAPRGYLTFEVMESEAGGAVRVHLPPDMATCDACLRELWDPADRRHRYPFINCVDCGPRFTIVHSLPYDRANTSMEDFTLCPDCATEYHDPVDRRFHAEPNACPVCGPSLFLLVAGDGRVADGREALKRSQEMLAAGAIVAVKGLGGYHLACNAFDHEAIARLRQRKRRPDKSLAVMFRDLETLRRYLHVDPAEAGELSGSAHPILVMDGRLSSAISPDTMTTGVFLPYAPLHHLLLRAVSRRSCSPAAIGATSRSPARRPKCRSSWAP